MKKNKLTFDQYYKANKQRRADLARRFGFKNSDELMTYLKKNGFATLNKVGSYKEYNSLSKVKQLEMAKENGYSTIAAYKSFLRSKFKVTTVVSTETVSTTVTSKPPKNIIHVFILDESSSMGGFKETAMWNGVKETVEVLKKEQNHEVNHSIGIVGFSYSSMIDKLEILEPQKVYVKSHIKGGMTALNDAIIKTLKNLEQHLDKTTTKAVVQIFTDGGENCSSASLLMTAKTIREAEDKGVTVTFMGTKTDVDYIKKRYSLKEGNTLVHKNTAESISQIFRTASEATAAYTKAVVNDEDVSSNFYSKVLIK